MNILQFLFQNHNSPVRIHVLLHNVAVSSNNLDNKKDTYVKKCLVSEFVWTNQNWEHLLKP